MTFPYNNSSGGSIAGIYEDVDQEMNSGYVHIWGDLIQFTSLTPGLYLGLNASGVLTSLPGGGGGSSYWQLSPGSSTDITYMTGINSVTLVAGQAFNVTGGANINISTGSHVTFDNTCTISLQGSTTNAFLYTVASYVLSSSYLFEYDSSPPSPRNYGINIVEPSGPSHHPVFTIIDNAASIIYVVNPATTSITSTYATAINTNSIDAFTVSNSTASQTIISIDTIGYNFNIGANTTTITPITDGTTFIIQNAAETNTLVSVNTSTNSIVLSAPTTIYTPISGGGPNYFQVLNNIGSLAFTVNTLTDAVKTLYNTLDDGSGDMIITPKLDSNIALTINNASSISDYTFQTGVAGQAIFNNPLIISTIISSTTNTSGILMITGNTSTGIGAVNITGGNNATYSNNTIIVSGGESNGGETTIYGGTSSNIAHNIINLQSSTYPGTINVYGDVNFSIPSVTANTLAFFNASKVLVSASGYTTGNVMIASSAGNIGTVTSFTTGNHMIASGTGAIASSLSVHEAAATGYITIQPPATYDGQVFTVLDSTGLLTNFSVNTSTSTVQTLNNILDDGSGDLIIYGFITNSNSSSVVGSLAIYGNSSIAAGTLTLIGSNNGTYTNNIVYVQGGKSGGGILNLYGGTSSTAAHNIVNINTNGAPGVLNVYGTATITGNTTISNATANTLATFNASNVLTSANGYTTTHHMYANSTGNITSSVSMSEAATTGYITIQAQSTDGAVFVVKNIAGTPALTVNTATPLISLASNTNIYGTTVINISASTSLSTAGTLNLYGNNNTASGTLNIQGGSNITPGAGNNLTNILGGTSGGGTVNIYGGQNTTTPTDNVVNIGNTSYPGVTTIWGNTTVNGNLSATSISGTIVFSGLTPGAIMYANSTTSIQSSTSMFEAATTGYITIQPPATYDGQVFSVKNAAGLSTYFSVNTSTGTVATLNNTLDGAGSAASFAGNVTISNATASTLTTFNASKVLTSASGYTNGNVMIASGTGNITSASGYTNGNFLVATGTGAITTASNLTSGTLIVSSGTGALASASGYVNGNVVVANGTNNIATATGYTNGNFLVATGTGAITTASNLTSGTLIVSSGTGALASASGYTNGNVIIASGTNNIATASGYTTGRGMISTGTGSISSSLSVQEAVTTGYITIQPVSSDGIAFLVKNVAGTSTDFSVNTSSGTILTLNNTLDDGSGNMIVKGYITNSNSATAGTLTIYGNSSTGNGTLNIAGGNNATAANNIVNIYGGSSNGGTTNIYGGQSATATLNIINLHSSAIPGAINSYGTFAFTAGSASAGVFVINNTTPTAIFSVNSSTNAVSTINNILDNGAGTMTLGYAGTNTITSTTNPLVITSTSTSSAVTINANSSTASNAILLSATSGGLTFTSSTNITGTAGTAGSISLTSGTTSGLFSLVSAGTMNINSTSGGTGAINIGTTTTGNITIGNSSSTNDFITLQTGANAAGGIYLNTPASNVLIITGGGGVVLGSSTSINNLITTNSNAGMYIYPNGTGTMTLGTVTTGAVTMYGSTFSITAEASAGGASYAASTYYVVSQAATGYGISLVAGSSSTNAINIVTTNASSGINIISAATSGNAVSITTSGGIIQHGATTGSTPMNFDSGTGAITLNTNTLDSGSITIGNNNVFYTAGSATLGTTAGSYIGGTVFLNYLFYTTNPGSGTTSLYYTTIASGNSVPTGTLAGTGPSGATATSYIPTFKIDPINSILIVGFALTNNVYAINQSTGALTYGTNTALAAGHGMTFDGLIPYVGMAIVPSTTTGTSLLIWIPTTGPTVVYAASATQTTYTAIAGSVSMGGTNSALAVYSTPFSQSPGIYVICSGSSLVSITNSPTAPTANTSYATLPSASVVSGIPVSIGVNTTVYLCDPGTGKGNIYVYTDKGPATTPSAFLTYSFFTALGYYPVYGFAFILNNVNYLGIYSSSTAVTSLSGAITISKLIILNANTPSVVPTYVTTITISQAIAAIGGGISSNITPSLVQTYITGRGYTNLNVSTTVISNNTGYATANTLNFGTLSSQLTNIASGALAVQSESVVLGTSTAPTSLNVYGSGISRAFPAVITTIASGEIFFPFDILYPTTTISANSNLWVVEVNINRIIPATSNNTIYCAFGTSAGPITSSYFYCSVYTLSSGTGSFGLSGTALANIPITNTSNVMNNSATQAGLMGHLRITWVVNPITGLVEQGNIIGQTVYYTAGGAYCSSSITASCYDTTGALSAATGLVLTTGSGAFTTTNISVVTMK